MAITEIFPNPTVKTVIFQITFPNLFYIENRMGEFQIKIMKEFPQSALLYRRQVLFAEMGPETKLEIPEEQGQKIWQFSSEKKYQLNVLSSSLDITSNYHKTYNLGDGVKFRDIIEFVLSAFFEITSVPVINRVGLRYIDECPIPSKDNEGFRAYYNSVFPLDRFNLSDANEMTFVTTVKRSAYYVRYVESLAQQDNNDPKLILDFDGFAKDISSKDCLPVTDELHDLISEEFERTIKGPVYEYMRKGADKE